MIQQKKITDHIPASQTTRAISKFLSYYTRYNVIKVILDDKLKERDVMKEASNSQDGDI